MSEYDHAEHLALPPSQARGLPTAFRIDDVSQIVYQLPCWYHDRRLDYDLVRDVALRTVAATAKRHFGSPSARWLFQEKEDIASDVVCRLLDSDAFWERFSSTPAEDLGSSIESYIGKTTQNIIADLMRRVWCEEPLDDHDDTPDPRTQFERIGTKQEVEDGSTGDADQELTFQSLVLNPAFIGLSDKMKRVLILRADGASTEHIAHTLSQESGKDFTDAYIRVILHRATVALRRRLRITPEQAT